jgi:hypothetical protein
MTASAPTPAVSRPFNDPAKLLYRAPVGAAVRPALIAIGIAWAITILVHLVYLVREFLWTINDGPDYIPEAFSDFGEGAIVNPLLFFLGAGALLVVLVPLLPSAPLLTVILRAALAGVGGFVVVSVKGLIEGIGEIANFGFFFGYFVNDWVGYPLVVALDLTALLVIGAVLSWVLANRKAAPAA